MSADGTRPSTSEACERVERFLDGYERMSGLDPERITGLGIGREDTTRDLLVSDLRALVAAVARLRREAFRGYTSDAHLRAVLSDITSERARQDEKWGEQNHPDGTGCGSSDQDTKVRAIQARSACEAAFRNSRGTWRHILMEEVCEAMAEDSPASLRDELVQVAAVATAWIEALDRRGSLVTSEGRAASTTEERP